MIEKSLLMKRPLLGLFLATLASFALAKPPNIIFIHADDLGWADLECYGSTFYETPNIDRLAKTGVRFTNAYASCPVCSPTRASVMTGKYPAKLNMTAHLGDTQPENWNKHTPLKPAPYQSNLPHEEITIAEQFHEAGYATLHVGKWHLGGPRFWPEYHGFDVNVGGWSQGGPFGGKQYFSPYANPRLVDGTEGEYMPDRLAEEVARFIEAHRYEPFFVHYAPYLVHVPLQSKDSLIRKYENKLASLPKIEDDLIAAEDGKVRARQDLPVYAAMVEALDTAVGHVLDKLDETQLAEHTIVIFTSDNGGLATGDAAMPPEQGWPTTNAPLRAGKGWLYEGGIREPLIARVPGITPTGITSDYQVTSTDYYPTLLALAGIDDTLQEDLDGRDFSGVLRGESQQRGPIYWHYPHYGNQGGAPGGAIRDGKWKLIEWYGVGSDSTVELYDLSSDIGEANNLAESNPKKRDELLAKLSQWRESQGALMPTANASFASEASAGE